MEEAVGTRPSHQAPPVEGVPLTLNACQAPNSLARRKYHDPLCGVKAPVKLLCRLLHLTARSFAATGVAAFVYDVPNRAGKAASIWQSQLLRCVHACSRL